MSQDSQAVILKIPEPIRTTREHFHFSMEAFGDAVRFGEPLQPHNGHPGQDYNVRRIELSLLAIAAEGDTVFTHHRVKVDKKDGAQTMMEVLARFTLSNGQILRCQEITRLLSGDHNDHDLGSRL